MAIVKALIDLEDIDITPEEFVEYLTEKADADYEIEFMNLYYSKSNWKNNNETEDMSYGLSSEAKDIMEKLTNGKA